MLPLLPVWPMGLRSHRERAERNRERPHPSTKLCFAEERSLRFVAPTAPNGPSSGIGKHVGVLGEEVRQTFRARGISLLEKITNPCNSEQVSLFFYCLPSSWLVKDVRQQSTWATNSLKCKVNLLQVGKPLTLQQMSHESSHRQTETARLKPLFRSACGADPKTLKLALIISQHWTALRNWM